VTRGWFPWLTDVMSCLTRRLDEITSSARGQPESYPGSFEFGVAASCLHVVIAVRGVGGSSKMAQ
jgi:hypothetical protein